MYFVVFIEYIVWRNTFSFSFEYIYDTNVEILAASYHY